jgi:endonuclease-3
MRYGTSLRSYKTVADRLTATYGAPSRSSLPLGNKADPLDELIYIILTVMTEFGVDEVYARIKTRWPRWEEVLLARESELVRALQPIGLSTQRAQRIRALLAAIVEREGEASLHRLKSLPDDEVGAYLVSLPGVGKKVARCVMLYSLGRAVFPVDAHVLRVLQRLGLAEPDLSLVKAQDALQQRVPELLRYTLHVNLVIHGRTVCRARAPRCGDCVLHRRCAYARMRRAACPELTPYSLC